MDRIVRQIQPKGDGEESSLPRRFSDFADKANVVLLGDPGAGKTHLFKEYAGACGAKYQTARVFLIAPPPPPDAVLFIDALDERRTGRRDRDTVDALSAKLFHAKPSKVRLSCRVADWLGDTDLASLGVYFETQGEPFVLYLEKLSSAEQHALLAVQGYTSKEAEAFVKEAAVPSQDWLKFEGGVISSL